MPDVSHSSDGEESAPELLTLSSTKKESRQRAHAVNAFEAAQRAKRKEANRARDAALKEAKTRAREESSRMEAQVKRRKAHGRRRETPAKVNDAGKKTASAAERTSAEAVEEGSASDSGSASHDDEDKEWAGVKMSDEEDDSGSVDGTHLASSNHLPDHFFAAAATQRPPKNAIGTAPTSASKKPAKIKHKNSKAKEQIIGTRTFVTLPPRGKADLASLTRPPERVTKFLTRTLQLKKSTNDGAEKGSRNSLDGTKKGAPRRWERRPVNLGVLRSARGPAARFVRES